MSDLTDFLVHHEADLDWLEHALCADMEITDFFVEAGHTISQDVINVCRMCPVRVECVTHAYEHHITGGYFGGISPGQRRDMDLKAALKYAERDVLPPRDNRGRRPRR